MSEEDRQKAVQKYLEGESPTAICKALGYSKRWLYKWVNRYESKKKGLVRRSVESSTAVSGSNQGGNRSGRQDGSAPTLQRRCVLWNPGHSGRVGGYGGSIAAITQHDRSNSQAQPTDPSPNGPLPGQGDALSETFRPRPERSSASGLGRAELLIGRDTVLQFERGGFGDRTLRGSTIPGAGRAKCF